MWVIIDFEANFGLRHVLGLGDRGKGCCGRVPLISDLQRRFTHTVGAHPRKDTHQGWTEMVRTFSIIRVTGHRKLHLRPAPGYMNRANDEIEKNGDNIERVPRSKY